ncbi:DNA-processing protein DprA [Homoserinibacter sp. GY 40078]|uniref:DNA-processing protein DprA n=1 Tax=Homoserinibacter sp. GY 40078 TaxID=2603275 RepID=UPI0011CBB010|nr:DNA-processing protein DprA [Homoserinibacter sp. GY 40078]TXK17044.1 DNA-protecting protein DprA [Homoserinibacter sp. GY 40078]
MRILGIPAATLASLIKPLGGAVDDRGAVAERFARATWTLLAEPGDRIARLVIAALGAEDALAALLDDHGGGGLVRALASAGHEHDADDIVEAATRWAPRISRESATLSLTQAARFGIQLVIPGDPEWPCGLDDLGEHAPLAMWMRGRRETLHRLADSIAIVGARAASGYGEHVTVEASAGLVDRGYAIVSGAAYGIDGAAHRSALASRGITVAVLAGGLDRFYPSGHDELITRIAEHGAVLSEVPCGVAPTRWRFLQRNRIIAAISRATVVVEAGARSGSLNTAGHAAALGRPLGAVPGPVTSTASAGCHRLLREYDAICVTSAQEMAELAPRETPEFAVTSETESRGGSADDRSLLDDPSGVRLRLLDALSTRTSRTAEKVAAIAGLALDRTRAELGLLALDGLVKERGEGWVRVSG